MNAEKKTSVVIVGLGYVGLPLAILLGKNGHIVKGIVRNAEKAKLISQGISPIKDNLLKKELKKCPVETSVNFDDVANTKRVIICVPTPVKKNNAPDYQPLILACKKIGKFLKKGTIVILESTVNPGTTEGLVIPILEKESKLEINRHFYVSHCPERINPGDPNWNIENIPRVVGASSEKALKTTISFYKSFLKGEVTAMKSIKEAEAVKIVENCFRDINIAFVNELAMSFSRMEIDVLSVIEGANTKPFAFLPHYPGCGVGGHCIPVDPYYLINYAQKNGFIHKFLKLARKINSNMPNYTVGLLKDGLKDRKKKIKNLNVAVLGLAYKANIDDHRESPAFDIIDILKKNKFNPVIYDPNIPKKSTAVSLDEALKKSDAAIIVTDHDEFKKITPIDLKKNKIEILIDGRNCLKKELFVDSGIYYKGIGR
ncbi:MAG: hypothetical protein COU25_01105 [Candidatus Levybacteria bacterium CG10_big_fil_rev_8_21_14_0_10_35_13]|nr:MAG: hypothetical protein COU25_01105 [Candidatus Levybacteria bacterium CG10_big_fil_rev_8_21_14_0_10_35_13]